MTRQTNITEVKMEMLKQFDYYVRNIIGDEEITDYWLMVGLPDGYDDNDLKEIALDEKEWLCIVQAFSNCCKDAGVIE